MAAADILLALAAAVRATWLPHARMSSALGLMLDESTTVASEGMLILYLRYLHLGRPATRFWKLVYVTDASAEGIFANLNQAFNEDDISQSAVASLSTDGASVMLGSKTGIAVRMKALWNGTLLVCHCIAHRAALCASTAAKGHAISEWFERCLRDIIFYYSHSSERMAALKAIQKDLKLRQLTTC